MTEQKFKFTVKPKTRLIDINLKEIWAYRDLIALFVKRDFISKYKQTILGPAWAVIQPLLTTVVFTVVFGTLAGLPTFDTASQNGLIIPSFLFYMAGNICWAYFSGCLTTCANTFIANASVMGKVYYPRLVMPISTIFSKLIDFVIQFALFAGCWIFYLCIGGTSISPTLWMLAIPLLVLQLALLGMGCGIIVSALTTKYRDLAMLISFAVQLWQYATPVAYGLVLVNGRSWEWLYMLNPVTPIITAFRYAVFGSGYFDLTYYGISWGITLAVLFIGIIIFNKVEKTFMDTV